MVLCGGETSKKKKTVKTIIIPKGVINPNENNIIEIPIHLDTNSSLIVKAPTDPQSCLSVEPYCNLHEVPQSTHVQEVPRSSHQDNSVTYKSTGVSTDSSNARGSTEQSTTSNVSLPTQKISTQTQCSGINLEPASRYNQIPEKYCVEAHSPICPICSRASCKYARPYCSPLLTKPSLNACIPVYSKFPEPSNLNEAFYYPSMKSAKSDIIIRPETTKNIDETAVLNKLLEEKLDKILKPILMSLARSLPDEDEKELSPRCSIGSLLIPKYSRDRSSNYRRCSSPLFSFDDYPADRSWDSRRRYCSTDSGCPTDYGVPGQSSYDDYERVPRGSYRHEKTYRDPFGINSNRAPSLKSNDSEEDMLRRRRIRSSGKELYADETPLKHCGTNENYKRSTVNFKPRKETEREAYSTSKLSAERGSTDLFKGRKP